MLTKSRGQLIARATRVFSTLDQADRWLRRPAHALGGETPLQAMQTTEGVAIVERELGRLADEQPGSGRASREAA